MSGAGIATTLVGRGFQSVSCWGHNEMEGLHFDSRVCDDGDGVGAGPANLESPTALAAAQRHLLATLGEGSLKRPRQAPAPCPFQSHHSTAPQNPRDRPPSPERGRSLRSLCSGLLASLRCRAFTHPALGRSLGMLVQPQPPTMGPPGGWPFPHRAFICKMTAKSRTQNNAYSSSKRHKFHLKQSKHSVIFK